MLPLDFERKAWARKTESVLGSLPAGPDSVQLRWKVGRAGRALVVLVECDVEADKCVAVSEDEGQEGGEDGGGGDGSDFSESKGIWLALGVS